MTHTAHTWNNGDVLTASLLNALETDLAAAAPAAAVTNVDNTADANKPVSTAQAAADTAVRVYATQRSNHTGTQSADTVTDGTTNKAYTATEQTKLAGIATGATANRPDTATDAAIAAAVTGLINGAPGALDTLKELADAMADDAAFASTVTNALATKAPLASPTFTGTVTGITAAMVGLSNVDNTADTAKPVSAAQQTAINARLAAAANLSDLGSASTARTNLGLGTAATQPATAFDAAGAAAAVTLTTLGGITPAAVDTKLANQNATNASTYATQASVATGYLPVSHLTATDPHGDRAYADQEFALLTADPFGFGYVATAALLAPASAQTWSGANDVKYSRVISAGTYTKIGLHVSVSSGNIALFHFSGTGTGVQRVPLTKVSGSGSVPCPAAGYQEISMGGTFTAKPGDFLALWCDNVTASFFCVNGATSSLFSAISLGQSGGTATMTAPGTTFGTSAKVPQLRAV